jgi:hypothetical protein
VGQSTGVTPLTVLKNFGMQGVLQNKVVGVVVLAKADIR